MGKKKKGGGGSSGAVWLRRGYKPRRGPEGQDIYTPGTLFVAMAFDRSPDESLIFQKILKVCEKYNLIANRVDQKFDSGPIYIQVIDAIEDSEFLIFDLTGERPNVYYELGYAHGVGNRPEDIILIAEKGTKIHFDIMPLRIILYDNPEDLENKLLVRLGNLIAFHRRKKMSNQPY